MLKRPPAAALVASAALAAGPTATGSVATGSVAQADGLPDGLEAVAYFEHDGLDRLLASEHDGAIRSALGMIARRVGELPGELGFMTRLPEDAATLATGMLVGPTRILVTRDEDATGGAFGYGLFASVPLPDRVDGASMHMRMVHAVGGELLGDAGLLRRSADEPGMHQTTLPFGTLRFGVTTTDGGEGEAYELRFGTVNHPDLPLGALAAPQDDLPLPDGFDGFLRLGFDLRGLTAGANLASVMLSQFDENVAQLRPALTRLGLLGPGAVRVDVELGETGDGGAALVGVARRSRTLAEFFGTPTEPLGPADFFAVPRDARFARFSRFYPDHEPDVASLLPPGELRAAAGAGLGPAFEMLSGALGIDIEDDLLGAIGDTSVLYASDTTGGGSLASMVLLIELDDPGTFGASLEAVRRAVRDLLAAQGPAGRYVRLSSWEHEMGGGERAASVDFVTVRGAGLPIPIEPTYGVAGRWLVVALSPASAAAAARQAIGRGDAGLLAVPAFRDALPASGEVHDALFIKTPAAIADGYPWVGMLGGALGNAVRSPGAAGDPREPAFGGGLMVPPLADLREGARPIVGWSRWIGEDMYFQRSGDRSLIVNAAGILGSIDGLVDFAAGLVAGGILGERVSEEIDREAAFE